MLIIILTFMKKLLLFILCIVIANANAANRNWKPMPGSSAWGNSNNWTELAVPNSSDDVFIPNASSNFPEISSAANCLSITFASGGTVP